MIHPPGDPEFSGEQPPEADRESLMEEQALAILRRVDALPTLDERPENEILGYDSQGLPGKDEVS